MTPRSEQVRVTESQLEAQAAAARAQVLVVEPRDQRSIRLVADAGARVWGPGGTLAPNELQALVHAGDPVHLALDLRRPERPVVGFGVGFLGWSPTVHVHSHQVGVFPGQRRRGVGYALKLAQRHTCLDFGIDEMRWTFDPLVRRNAAFNVEALGARAAAFHEDFYGEMYDEVNGGDASDRLEAVWDLSRPLPRRGRHQPQSADEEPGEGGEPVPTLLVERDGWPEVTGTAPCSGALVAVPADYEAIRRRDPDLRAAWRIASRQVLKAAYDAGLRIGHVTGTGYRLVSDDES
jgi:predicted GNAT superfamily acetyltransferase